MLTTGTLEYHEWSLTLEFSSVNLSSCERDMALLPVYCTTVPDNGLLGRSRSGRSIGRRSRHVVGFGLAGLLLAARSGVLQAQDQYRMAVRPRAMATGARNPAAGEYRLNAMPDAILTVPPQCAGVQRCPLVFVLPGAGLSSRLTTEWHRPMAEKYGMLLLTVTNYDGDGQIADAGLQEILRTFAVDPDKIALIGRCGSGTDAWHYGSRNSDVFSRIGLVSAGPFPNLDQELPNKAVEFFLEVGILETGHFRKLFTSAQKLRGDGHSVKLVVGLRGHEHQLEDYDFLGHWLQESWATSGPATPSTSVVVADSPPVLTITAVEQLTAFWTRFAEEPESIRTTVRHAHLHEVVVPVGTERPSVWITEMPALAARYPSVAADLAKAGLTAQQYDAYRVALIAARIAQGAEGTVGAVAPTSVLGQNVAFVDAHPDALETLGRAGIEHPDRIGHGLDRVANLEYPNVTESIGLLGMWRTP